ncbi:hypothetical protein DICPUDRAFT_155597 [Dictyostelium purpureum]|uniref:GH16 domain-containing protein n=1 Tax=Dictyostelium purpureum TaxID=5786 RepID=F0ZUF3_DICPU|nr:uncharacterized protein DICPUDRAFT_155597 [Dictyostelium purpureum]EGC32437.1 hypothetical protein DICPUDRAFT_155597 [Dictyostelium purpureum]|eukprot:XP_003291049.1 hypothetical protein DICPUDRAFT_155597 [Dictyostelium purpureum]
MKYKKLFILLLSVLLLSSFIEFGNCNKQDSDDHGKLALETKVPDLHSDSNVPVSVDESDSESNSGSSSVSHEKINGRDIIECNNTAVSLSVFEYRETSIDINPYSCALKNPFGKNTKLSKGSPLVIDKCDTADCFDHKYSCSEIEINQDMGYGSYSIMIKGGRVSNTKIYISLETDSSTNGKEYSNVFFKILGNTTMAHVGFTQNGERNEETTAKVQLDKGFEDTMTNYTILYTQFSLAFFANGKELKNFQTLYMNVSVITPPIVYRVLYSVENYNGKVSASNLPSTIYVQDFDYLPGPCIDDEEGEVNFIPKPYYDYYVGNCTTKDAMIIYNGTMDADWDILGPTTISPNNTDVKRLEYSISCAFNYGKNYLRFKAKKPFPVDRHRYLTFWVNGGNKSGQTLWVHLALGNFKISTINLNDYILGGIKKKQWSKIIIPMKKFQLRKEKPNQLMDGFMIEPTHNQYMDRVFFDFVAFSNGSRCVSTLNSLPIFKNGRMNNKDPIEQESFQIKNSIGNVDFNGQRFGTGKNITLEYQIQVDSKIQINFENGSLETYDALNFKFQYIPDTDYVFSGSTFNNQPNPLRLEVCLLTSDGIATYTCLDLSSYVGGLFPTNKWFTLSIPWIDLSANVIDGAKIGGILIKCPDDMDATIHQGSLVIQTIELVYFRLPEKEKLLDSFAIKSVQLNNLFYITILSISTIFLLL